MYRLRWPKLTPVFLISMGQRSHAATASSPLAVDDAYHNAFSAVRRSAAGVRTGCSRLRCQIVDINRWSLVHVSTTDSLDFIAAANSDRLTTRQRVAGKISPENSGIWTANCCRCYAATINSR